MQRKFQQLLHQYKLEVFHVTHDKKSAEEISTECLKATEDVLKHKFHYHFQRLPDADRVGAVGEGWRIAMQANGLAAPPHLIGVGDWTAQSGYALTRAMLGSPDRPTAPEARLTSSTAMAWPWPISSMSRWRRLCWRRRRRMV